MNWRLEAWNPAYALNQAALEEAPAHQDPIEPSPEGDWRPMDPTPLSWPSILYFVDGRMRLDAQIANQANQRALLLSLAIGALVRDDGGIRLARHQVHRVLLHAGGFDQPIRVGGLIYQPQARQANTIEELMKEATRRMREYEAELAAELQGDLVVVDGPLFHGNEIPSHPVLGYSKTFTRMYLNADEAQLLHRLESGQRSPIFRVAADHSRRIRDLWVWYLRLPLTPSFPFHSGASLLRVETPYGPAPAAIQLANLSSSLFAQTASHPARDPRAPQNLIPVGGLEQLLGRQMGSLDVIRRQITASLVPGDLS